MKTLDIDQCAEFHKINRAAASQLAIIGDLPGARIGPAWVFLEDDLVEYLRALIRRQQRERQSAKTENKQTEAYDEDEDIRVTLPGSVLQNRRNREASSQSLTATSPARND